MQILGGLGVCVCFVFFCFFATLRKQLADNAYKSYHYYKVIVVLSSYRVSKNVDLFSNCYNSCIKC